MRLTSKFVAAVFLVAGLAAGADAAFEPAPTPSTGPIGGTFYRRLAYDFDLDIRELVKLERRGFGRAEVVTLVLVSKATGTSVKDYAKRRLKDKVLLKDLATEAGLDYPTVMKNAQAIKDGIEAKGEENMPPPVFEPSPTPPLRKKKKRKGEPEASPTPTDTPSVSASPGDSPSPALPTPSPMPTTLP